MLLRLCDIMRCHLCSRVAEKDTVFHSATLHDSDMEPVEFKQLLKTLLFTVAEMAAHSYYVYSVPCYMLTCLVIYMLSYNVYVNLLSYLHALLQCIVDALF